MQSWLQNYCQSRTSGSTRYVDQRDWDQQSVKMFKIYHNAYATIATPASGSCTEGFRHETRRRIYVPFGSQLNRNIQGFFSLRYLECLSGNSPYMWGGGLIYMASVDSSQWRSRGWTFQEELMSTRLLIFAPEEIYFNAERKSAPHGYFEMST